MQTQEPAGENAPAADQAAQPTSAVSEAPGAAPLFTGPAPILWTGFAGAAIVFVVVFFLVLNGRVGRADPRRPRVSKTSSSSKSIPSVTSERPDKKQRKRGRNTEFFQPAGEDAEITFDDQPLPLRTAPPRAAKNEPAAPRLEPEAEVIIERSDAVHGETPREEAPLAAPSAEDEPARRTSPFAGLFAKKKREENAAKEPVIVDAAPQRQERLEKAARFNPFASERATPIANPFAARAEEEEWVGAPDAPDREDDRHPRFDEAERASAEADERRRLEAEREAEFERRKQAAFDRQQAMDERERALASRSATLESQTTELRRDLAYELDERFQALSDRLEARLRHRDGDIVSPGEDVGRALSTLGREIDDRFSALAERLEARVAAAAMRGGAANDDRGASDGADALARSVAQHRDMVNESLAAMASRIDDLAGAPVDVKSLRAEIANLKRALSERASGPAAPVIQLADIVRNALPPNAYEMRAMLPNNRKADCLVRLAHPPGPIAIDARFPVEAFHRLHAAEEGEERAENEFRRAALRHVVDIAERLIIPNETAESALMFVPSESMYSELHARFPDVIQDSYRARVWIVSPTTLMATLHTVRAVLRDAQARESADLIQSEAQHVLAEVDALRRRVVALEENFNKARHDVRDLISSTDQVYRRAETISNTRRTLAEGAFDRASRKFAAAREDEAEEITPPSAVVAAPPRAREEEPDLWEDDHSEADDRAPFPLR